MKRLADTTSSLLPLPPVVQAGCPSTGLHVPQAAALPHHDNSLFASPTALLGSLPALLPTTWTSRTAPRSFPALQSLVVHPGNENICFLPNGTDRTLSDGTTFYGSGESYQDINGGEASGRPQHGQCV